MDIKRLIKFNENIVINGQIVMAIYGEIDKTTGHSSIYLNAIQIEAISQNKEEVQLQIDNFKTKLKENMVSENFFYTI